MDRDTQRVVVVALLAVLGLAAAAATLDSATSTGGGMGPSDSGGQGFDDDEGDSVLPSEQNEGGGLFGGSGAMPTFGCFDLLRDPTTIAAVILVVVAALLLVRWRYDWIVSTAFLVAFGVPGGMIYMLLAACPTPSNDDGGLLPEGGDLPEGGGMLGEEIGRTVPSTPSLLLLVLLAGAFVLAAAVIVRGTDDEEVRPGPTAPEPDDRAAAVAAAAGRTADRIEADGDLENEIYRAWREMVDLLDVSNPRATTPGEFADAAAAAGIARDDVDELTELFEAVRYGGIEPTDERERRAVAALRRIEDGYEQRSGWSGDEERAE